MRMRPETKRKLEAAARAERRLRWLLIGALLGVLALVSVGTVPLFEDEPVTGKVVRVTIEANPERGPKQLRLLVELPAGHQVRADSDILQAPALSERVVLSARRNLLGFRSYRWFGDRAS